MRPTSPWWCPVQRAPFDVVLLDPPYRTDDQELAAVLAALATHLGPEAVVVVERAARAGAVPWPDDVLAEGSRRYGDTAVHRGRAAAREAEARGSGEHVGVTAVCPGSFDPITMGHLDIVQRAAGHLDRLVVAVLDNPSKAATAMFTTSERIELIRACVEDLPNVEVDAFSGLLVDYCREQGITTVCKGLRGVTDFEYEVPMANMNRRIGDVETLFMTTSPQFAYLSSSLVKEVARGGGVISGTVPQVVEEAMRRRLAEES